MPNPPQAIQDTVALNLSRIVALLLTGMFLWLIDDIVAHGLSGLSWEFFTSSPRNAGREGGIAPILVSTMLILVVCMMIALPIGLGTAILLSEVNHQFGWMTNLIRRSLDVLAGIPSIVFGLFGNAFFCVTLGLGFSIVSGGLTLACMVLPMLIRSTEEGFRALPVDYRLSAAALGLSQTSILISILIPAAMPALLAGFILGLGRAIAETAALIFTSGYVDRMPESLWDSGRALSIHIYDLSMNVPGGNANAYASALVLITLLFVINAGAKIIGYRWSSKRVLSA
ncbi:phosphate ABC transporter permease PstA [Candidatus Nitronereus thalassa]|uniref:Phosphate transport system permease protein PstA n=1 Tax=Candidatus Nitronereus thalassa TaxID=3020898 RepID=A0ABU3K9W0_9BACT|nr:phosphate ABC transporter permease PstA [Candidatus Nitronereus thalassa]MDT7043197.1 phosphate ABC transporter permease PstA [Candidatus Nitronereus thalassa]